ncbi:MAG: MBL fold metallo-hydrolase [Cytophagales bacterium]|nr:MAG: MBL fold metallo-hydrolase [Cytophagales bacterium]
MHIEQFFDTGLAHSSYAIVSDGKMALVDPARDPQPYYDFAKKHQSTIVAVFETHPHADFVSSHLEIHQTTGATIYASRLVGAEYPHHALEDGEVIVVGKARFEARLTPGHSPDSISIFVSQTDQPTKEAVFTGDTLFVGDVGRPDLREKAGNIQAKREELAKQMYHTTRHIFMPLKDDMLVYPAHGAGSLCGKGLSDERFSRLQKELQTNYALQEMSEDKFVDVLLEGQPFIPKYFGYNVDLNKKGAPAYQKSLVAVPRIAADAPLKAGILIVDTRPATEFRKKHLPNALNIPDGGKFETWLGSIVSPTERFYLIAENTEKLEIVIQKSAKIGYELLIEAALTLPTQAHITDIETDLAAFEKNTDAFTIIDIKNDSEVATQKPFAKSLHIPLPELRERVSEIPTEKPIMVHCAGGYRSGIGASILRAALPQTPVYDLAEAILKFQ